MATAVSVLPGFPADVGKLWASPSPTAGLIPTDPGPQGGGVVTSAPVVPNDVGKLWTTNPPPTTGLPGTPNDVGKYWAGGSNPAVEQHPVLGPLYRAFRLGAVPHHEMIGALRHFGLVQPQA